MDTVIASLARDTLDGAFQPSRARSFDLRRKSDRDSLRATLARERSLWRARRPRDYRFLLRVDCFCPGRKGWLLIEARGGHPPRAWDARGRPTPYNDWDTFTVDELFDKLRQSVDRNGTVEIAFDSRWHFPAYVRTVMLPGPDMWSIVELRSFRTL